MRKRKITTDQSLNNIVELPIFCLSLYELNLPDKVFNELLKNCEKLLSSHIARKKLNMGHRLAGRIREGIQLDLGKVTSQETKNFFEKSATAVMGSYKAAHIGIVKFKLESIWLVLQKEGDYNPPHSHSGDFSGVCYLKVPSQITKQKEQLMKNPKAPDTKDGVLEVIGTSVIPPNADARYGRMVLPEAGKLYLFPSWMIHSVNPFFGEGERLSVSFNLKRIDS